VPGAGGLPQVRHDAERPDPAAAAARPARLPDPERESAHHAVPGGAGRQDRVPQRLAALLRGCGPARRAPAGGHAAGRRGRAAARLAAGGRAAGLGVLHPGRALGGASRGAGRAGRPGRQRHRRRAEPHGPERPGRPRVACRAVARGRDVRDRCRDRGARHRRGPARGRAARRRRRRPAAPATPPRAGRPRRRAPAAPAAGRPGRPGRPREGPR
jgi:hypothetical protein